MVVGHGEGLNKEKKMNEILKKSNAVLITEWEYSDKSKFPHGECLYRLPNGDFVREQWVTGNKNENTDLIPCSESRVLQLLVWLEKRGHFPDDHCSHCGANNGPIWPGDNYGKYRIGHACCSCMAN